MGNSWRVSNDDGCPDPPTPTDPCDEVTREQKNWAEQYCAKFKQEPFRSCPVDVTAAYKVRIDEFRAILLCCLMFDQV